MQNEIEAATKWAIARVAEILTTGISKSVGVKSADEVRIQLVPNLPMPETPCLQPLLTASDLPICMG
jgi:hypothetical protein